MRTFGYPLNPEPPMPQRAAPNPQADADRLNAATDQAIAACDDDARLAVKAILLTIEYLETEVKSLPAAVSNGYARGKIEPVPRARKD